ncbi:MAG TPA: redoxin domain-containing protein [Bryobacteraceae bacterium]|nr:redoxin domain-containing protein [Bryobacteraceae bacterium]
MARTMLSVNSKAPQFTLNDLDGVSHSLAAILQRGPVLLILYKISCPVCQLTLPFLNRIANGGLQIVAISQDDAASTRRFQSKFGVNLPTLLDREEESYPVSNAFGITHVPSLFLVESDGTISFVSEGFIKKDLESLAERAGLPVFRQEETVPAWKAG